MKGAGGTEGGYGRFFLGLAMMIGGGYLFFDSIRVYSQFDWGYGIYQIGRFPMTTGMVLIPLIFGFVILFFKGKSPIGWILTGGSLIALGFGVLRSVQFRLINMSAFELIVILVLFFGGIGLFLSSFRTIQRGQRIE